MYEGYKKLSDHKSYCTKCYQRNFTTIEETGNKCGRCGANARVNKTFYEISSYPGKSIDMYEDFEEWSMSDLRSRVELVQSFDKMCDDVVAATINMAIEGNVVEEEVLIPQKVKRIEY